MFKQMAWSLVKPLVQAWLRSRALVLPAAKRTEVARRFGVTEDVVVGISGMLADQALTELDKFKP